MKEIFVSFGVDIDAVAGWLGSYGGEDSPSDIQRGMFSGEVGTPRLVRLFQRYDPDTDLGRVAGHRDRLLDSVRNLKDERDSLASRVSALEAAIGRVLEMCDEDDKHGDTLRGYEIRAALAVPEDTDPEKEG